MLNLKYKKCQLKLLVFYIFILVSFFSCKKDTNAPAPETGTVTDFEGNVYKTVKIGNQWWMAENLKATKYRNGKYIQKIGSYDTAQWRATVKGSYSIYNDDPSAPGFLYNWYAVNDSSNITPLGWHIPSDAEWKLLELNLGMSAEDADKMNWRGTNQGDKLKVQAPQGWETYTNDVWGTNESGFTALAGGCRMFNGEWSSPLGIGFMGFWWSSSMNGDNLAWYRYLDYKNKNIFRFYGLLTYGFSIRCVKD